jgi:RimK family alpha-L-glutamate ligase
MSRSGEQRKERPALELSHVAAPRQTDHHKGVLVQRFAIVARSVTQTNRRLLTAARALGDDVAQLGPSEARRWLQPGDVALGRIDVLPTLDGTEPGLEDLRALEDQGVTVLNRAGALLAAHDKLVTALRLGARGLPHPRTAHVGSDIDPGFGFPVVVKPRFGSWGKDVYFCRSRHTLRRCLRQLERREWFRRQGALVQELVTPQGHDLRLLVAAGEVIGAVERVAAPGEWRTNVALGGYRRKTMPPPEACVVALGAAAAVGADLVGIDLLPKGGGGWVVVELNGAADFTRAYDLAGQDVFARAAGVLSRYARSNAEEAAQKALTGSSTRT